MNAFEYQTAVSELFLSAARAKAITVSFCQEYMDEAKIDNTIFDIRADPEHFAMLFDSLFREVIDTYNRAKKLNETELKEAG